MVKKSRRNKKSNKKKSNNNTATKIHANSSPIFDYEESPLPQLSLDEVQCLPRAPGHIWKVTVHQSAVTVISVMDVTNAVFLPDCATLGMIYKPADKEDSTQIVNVILNGMKNPSSQDDNGDDGNKPFFSPRRPRFLLLDPELKSVFPHVKSQIELLQIPVRIYSEMGLTEAVQSVEMERNEPYDYMTTCTYAAGFIDATAAIVAKLPQNVEETWKIFNYGHEQSPTGSILVIENHTNKKKKTLVGTGVDGACNISLGILAAMNSPISGKAGGADKNIKLDTPHRPGRVVLHGALQTSGYPYIQEAMIGSGVEVMKDSEFSGKYGCCYNRECEKANSFREKDKFMSCVCKAVAYCGKECQKADWKEHKKTCKWYSVNKKKKKNH